MRRGLLIELPQPGNDVSVPKTAKVMANCTAVLSKKDLEGEPIARNGVCISLSAANLVYS